MDIEKIKLRNSASNLIGLVMGLLLVMGIFFGSYLYFAENVTDVNLTVDSKYSEAYTNLSIAQDDLTDNVNEIKDNFDDIKEAESTIESAWNGLKGLGNTLKLPINFLDVTLAAWQATTPTLDIIPGWAFALIFTGLVAFVVFLILKLLKGEPAIG